MTKPKPKDDSTSDLDRRRKTAQRKDGAGYSERRAKIIASAAAAFQEDGYDGTTFAAIAARAGTDRASVYYYASNKEELFQQVCAGMLGSNLAAAEEIAQRDIDASEKLALIIEHHMHTHAQGYPQWTVLVQEFRRITDATTAWTKGEVERMRRYESVVRSIIEDGQADGSLRSDIAPDLVMHSIFGMLNWTHRWYRPDGAFDPTVISSAFTAIAIEGLRATDKPTQ